jgi:hypothetical protein
LDSDSELEDVWERLRLDRGEVVDDAGEEGRTASYTIGANCVDVGLERMVEKSFAAMQCWLEAQSKTGILGDCGL